ncbi:hypothetical protein CFP56_010403 [Quercus suber]|uniref:Uncharacterized protein n=1 Tax=Quercus suber TaxID=58331 RepID=A0AAW0M5G6_QUESU
MGDKALTNRNAYLNPKYKHNSFQFPSFLTSHNWQTTGLCTIANKGHDLLLVPLRQGLGGLTYIISSIILAPANCCKHSQEIMVAE